MRSKKLVTYFMCFNLLSATIISGCAGKTPNPVQTYQPDDNYMSCSQIRQEIFNNQTELSKLFPESQKTGKNVALGVAGAFLIVPWFFMDFSDAERIEIQAFQRRDHHLHLLAQRKRCGKMPPRIKIAKQK